MKKSILAQLMMTMSMSTGLQQEPMGIRKARSIHRNWKDTQTEEEINLALAKARLKRKRKANRGPGFSKGC